jgi:hypothetical protein
VTKHLLTCGQSLISSLQVDTPNCGEYVDASHQLTLFYEGEASFFVIETVILTHNSLGEVCEQRTSATVGDIIV